MMNMAKDGRKKTFIDSSGLSATACALAIFLEATTLFAAGAQFQSYQTHSHFAISVDPDVTYTVEKNVKNGKLHSLKLILNNLREDPTDISHFRDLRTDKITVGSAGPNSVVYEFVFSDKAKTAGVEFFNYRNKVPSEVTLDYWNKIVEPKPGDSLSANATPQKKHDSVKSRAKTKGGSQKSVLDGQTASLSVTGCSVPLEVGTSGVTHWNVYHKPFGYRAFFKLESADTNYVYPIAKAKKGENYGKRAKEVAHYRLALKLFQESKYGLVLRTIEFFESRYPQSPLKKELTFLKASTFLKLAKQLHTERYFEQAMAIYQDIQHEYPDTERGQAALAFITQEMIERGTPIAALEYALLGTERTSKLTAESARKQYHWVYRLAAAESLLALGEHDRAESAFNQIVEQNVDFAPEAAFRVGEVFSARKYWERAILSYERAIAKFPKDANRFPTAWFNLAEAYYRIGRFAEAERNYQKYLEMFPNDLYAWAAGYRVAEIFHLTLKKPSDAQLKFVQKNYESVVNRFPYTPGAAMAELRIAECAGHKNIEFFKSFFQSRDLKKLESPILNLTELESWTDLAESRFYLSIKDYRSALKRSDEYRLKPTALTDSFKSVFAQAAEQLVTELSRDKNSEADLLAIVEHYGDWVKKPESFGYSLAIAKAKSSHGELTESFKMLQALEKRLPEASEKDRDFFWILKSKQEKLLGMPSEKVVASLNNIRDDGDFAPEKFDELSKSSTERNDFKAAVLYDNRILETPLAEKLSLERKIEIHLRRLDNLSRYASPSDVAKAADQALYKFGAQTQLAPALLRINEVRARASYEAGNFKGAIAVIDEILGLYPEHQRRLEFEFMRGKSLSALGREGEALETFRKLAQAAKDDIWKKSAQAELDQIQWEQNVPNLKQDRRSLK